MRHLRKITFINSARFDTGSTINLSGNTLLTGTQGVGKTTVDRAILFFYTADTRNLGIPGGMDNFQKFYFPNSNSYLVYEVEREGGAFTVLVSRNGSLPTFRFVDAPYNEAWIMDENGQAYTTTRDIVAHIPQGVAYSGQVTTFKEYCDIIYGSIASSSPLRRYSLMETSDYRHICRSIQNVFLNSRLDSEHIKNVIINSLDVPVTAISLTSFRKALSTLEKEYSDVSLWLTGGKDGRPDVRALAENLVKQNVSLRILDARTATLCGELRYAVRAAKAEISVITTRLADLAKEEKAIKEAQNEDDDRRSAEEGKLNRRLGAVLEFLKRCGEYHTKYSGIDIAGQERRVSNEPALRAERKALEQRLATLLATYHSVSDKYAVLIAGVDAQLAEYTQLKQQESNSLDRETNERIATLFSDTEKKKEHIEQRYAPILADREAAINRVRREQSDCDTQKALAATYDPNKEEIAEVDTKTAALTEENYELKAEIAALEAKHAKESAEYERELDSLLARMEDKEREKKAEASPIKERIAEIDALLAKTSGSFCQWLADNVPQATREHIERVASTETLYSDALQPIIASEPSDTLYGVSIDTSALSPADRTPAALTKQKTDLEGQVKAIEREIATLVNQHQQEEKAVKSRRDPKLRAIRKEREEKQMRIAMNETALKRLVTDRRLLVTDTTEKRTARMAELSALAADLADCLAKAEEARDKTNAERKSELSDATAACWKEKKELEEYARKQKEAIMATVTVKEHEAKEEKDRLRQQEVKELSDGGADTAAVTQCRDRISAIDGELSDIDKLRKAVDEYHRVKAEYFDREPSQRDEETSLNSTLALLKEKYAQRREENSHRLASVHKEMADADKRKAILDDGVRQAEKSGHLTSHAEAGESETTATPSDAVHALSVHVSEFASKEAELQRAARAFAGNFSQDNVFHFRTDLNTADDCREFAEKISDFLADARIEQYYKTLNSKYSGLLAAISQETRSLTAQLPEIDKMLLAMHKDFKEHNFIGAIRDIDMQSDETLTDDLVKEMKRIALFCAENEQLLGDTPLFSTQGDGEAARREAVAHLLKMKELLDGTTRDTVTLADMFCLQFRVRENQNDSGWQSSLSRVPGSNGTDTIAKAIINIMLISVFKKKASKRFADFQLHCIMDEIGTLADENICGIVRFANDRGIQLLTSAPKHQATSAFNSIYCLEKDADAFTSVYLLHVE